MKEHHLQLNLAKTELLVFPATPTLQHDFTIQINSSTITQSSSVRNLGVIFDDQLTFKDHIAKTAWSCRFLLHNIRKIRPFLTQHAAQLLVQALVISGLDYCNALLAGLPSCTFTFTNDSECCSTIGLQRTKKSPCHTSLYIPALAPSCSSQLASSSRHWCLHIEQPQAQHQPTSTHYYESTSPPEAPPTSTHYYESTSPPEAPPTSTHYYESTSPPEAPPTSTHYYESTSPPEAPPTSTHYYGSTSPPEVWDLRVSDASWCHHREAQNHSPEHSRSPFLAGGMIPPPPSGMLNPCQFSSDTWKLISSVLTWLLKKTKHVCSLSLTSPCLASFCSEQFLKCCMTSTPCDCLPLYNVSLIVFLNCKSLWIKASAKWINVNVNVRRLLKTCTDEGESPSISPQVTVDFQFHARTGSFCEAGNTL